jgi:hypothetical protein
MYDRANNTFQVLNKSEHLTPDNTNIITKGILPHVNIELHPCKQ